MADATFSVVGWDEFQHYKDRDPSWIKLHRGLLDNYAFSCLPDECKAHLVGIWLLAARHHNAIPSDADWVAKRISATSPVNLRALADAGFIVLPDPPASKALAPCKQVAMPEKRREEKRREEKRREEKRREEKSSADAGGKTTWLTPFVDRWSAAGGSPSPGQLARYLRPIVAEIGPERVAEALTRYLAAGKASFGVAVFARSWHDWDAPDGLSDKERRSKAVLESFAGEGL